MIWRLRTFITAAGLLVSLALLVNLAIEATIIPNDLETDRLYTYAFMHDLFIDGGSLSSWSLGQPTGYL